VKQSTLGSCIRSLRVHNQMTQTQLADQLGVTDKAVSKWERDLSYPDIALFPKLADVLGVTVNDLLRECGEECRPSKLLQAFEMSRDVRAPLHVILGFTEIAMQNRQDPDTVMHYLEGIKASGEYLMSLLDRVLQGGCCPADGNCREGNLKASEPWEQQFLDLMSSLEERRRSFDFSDRRILIADDMEINREIATKVLEKTGAITETAEDGLICLQKIKEHPAGYYDLILMDLIMPNMDGLEATRKIRKLDDPQKAEVPIIAMTSNVSDRDRLAARDAGMNSFAEKPIFVEKLFAEMDRFLTTAE